MTEESSQNSSNLLKQNGYFIPQLIKEIAPSYNLKYVSLFRIPFLSPYYLLNCQYDIDKSIDLTGAKFRYILIVLQLFTVGSIAQ